MSIGFVDITLLPATNGDKHDLDENHSCYVRVFCLSAVYFVTGMYTCYERLCYMLWMKLTIFSSRGSEALQIQTLRVHF